MSGVKDRWRTLGGAAPIVFAAADRVASFSLGILVALGMDKSLYIAYVSGAIGSTVVLYYIGNGIIAGVDASGMKYDGTYRIEDDCSYNGKLTYVIPAGVLLITGQRATEEQEIELPFLLPNKFWDGQIVRIDSPMGPVNAKFEKLKELPL